MDVSTAIAAIAALFADRPGPTIDTVKCGDPSQQLRGVAVTFMATRQVIAQAAASGANLLLTHEPTFFNHADETAWLEGDPVVAAKRGELVRHGLVVWRLHDRIHGAWPDLIDQGLLEAMGWGGAIVPDRPGVVRLSGRPLGELVAQLKRGLGIATVRVVGDPAARIGAIGIRPGASGGRAQIQLLRQPDIDAVVCGESPEWETCEYVRDALAAGIPKALIVLGHANSEEAGMRLLAERIRALLPGGIPVQHIPARDPFAFL